MSTATEHAASEAHVPGGSHEHPSDKSYIGIAVILAVLTTIEVLTYFVDFKDAHVPVLMVLMVAKFVLVALYFMHLKFDSPLFRRMFIIGLLLAIAVYIAMLCAFEVFA